MIFSDLMMQVPGSDLNMELLILWLPGLEEAPMTKHLTAT